MKKIGDSEIVQKAPKKTLASQYEMAYKIQANNKHIIKNNDGSVNSWDLPIMEENGELLVSKAFIPGKTGYVQIVGYYSDGKPVYCKEPIYKIETYEGKKGSFKYLKLCKKPTYDKGDWLKQEVL